MKEYIFRITARPVFGRGGEHNGGSFDKAISGKSYDEAVQWIEKEYPDNFQFTFSYEIKFVSQS